MLCIKSALIHHFAKKFEMQAKLSASFAKDWNRSAFNYQVKTSCVAHSELLVGTTFICLYLQYLKAEICVISDSTQHFQHSNALIRFSAHNFTTVWQLSNVWSHGSAARVHQQTIVNSISGFQTTVSLKVGGGVQTATITVPSEEWSSFECHFYILSHSLSPAHWDCWCYLLPNVFT